MVLLTHTQERVQEVLVVYYHERDGDSERGHETIKDYPASATLPASKLHDRVLRMPRMAFDMPLTSFFWEVGCTDWGSAYDQASGLIFCWLVESCRPALQQSLKGIGPSFVYPVVVVPSTTIHLQH